MLQAPAIDPVALSFWGHEIRWYSLAYMIGLLFVRWRLQRGLRRNVDAFLLGAVLAMYLWGRVVFELIYDSGYALAHPLEVLRPGGGGLAFHGSIVGVALATLAAARRWRTPFLKVTDEICTAVPLGIALGRIGNFLNQELWGRVTTLPWGVVFPAAGPEARHPSQLYESFLEGWLLLAVMQWAARFRLGTGLRTALFLTLYATARFVCEEFRQPDATIGFVFGSFSMGQVLSVLLLSVALAIIGSRRWGRYSSE